MTAHREARLHAATARRLLRQRTGRAHVVLTGRGATAIWAALRALGLTGAPVLIPANTCYLVLWAVLASDNVPVLVDIEPLTGNVTPTTLEQTGIARPGAIIPAHLYGIPAPMAELAAWARERGAALIEDCALTGGITVEGRPAGAWGNVSVFSFGRGKPVDMDNGGAAQTDDLSLATEMLRLTAELPLWNGNLQRLNREWLDMYWALHQHDTNPALAALYAALYALYRPLTTYRLPDAAWNALPLALANHDAAVEQRLERARAYDAAFASSALSALRRPDDALLWRYPLRVPAGRRDAVLHGLWDAGVLDATRWYPSLGPMRDALAPDAPKPPTPHADALAAEIINLPLDDDRTGQIIDIVLGAFEG